MYQWTRSILATSMLLMAPAAFAHEGHDHHAAADHKHGSPHGGLVQTVGSQHVEALVQDAKLSVWVLDGQEKTVAPPAEAKAIVLVNKKSFAVALKASGEALVGTLPADAVHQMAETKGKATVVVTLTVDGTVQSVKFAFVAPVHVTAPSPVKP
jgi:hypothetical protein